MSNRPEHVVALGGAWACGALHVGVDHGFTAPELAFVVELTQARALVYEPHADAPDPFLPLRILRERRPDLHVVVAGDQPAPEGFLPFAELLSASPDGAPARPASDDPALVFVTSGTTGRPKATLGYHGNLARRWRRLAGWLRFGPEDVHLAHLPLSHGFGLMMAVAALLGGGRLALVDRFSAEDALRLVEEEGVTVLNGAPAHFKLVLDRLDATGRDVGSLRLSVGTAASFPPDLVRAIWDRLGVELMIMYGSSEGVGMATTDRDDIVRGAVGRPERGSVLVVGPDRRPLPIGEVGEIAFSRRVFPVRYWGDEPARVGRWFYSGDLGRLDEEGRLYVLGRVKHQIDRGGLKVDPVEVEAALLRCAGVADAAVVGLPNPILGETVCACVVPGAEPAPSLERLRTLLSAELAPHKLPDELCVLDHIPRTPIGKVDLPSLRAQVAELGTESRRRPARV